MRPVSNVMRNKTVEGTPSEKHKFIVRGDEPDVAAAKATNPVHHLFHGKGGLPVKLRGEVKAIL